MKEATKKTTNQIISDFLTKNKVVLISVLSVIVVVLVAVGIYTSVQNGKIAEVGNAMTEIDTKYSLATNNENEADDFVNYALEVVETYPGTKAELAAYSRLASYYFDNEDFDLAFENYKNAYTKFPNDLANSVYMFNAAMAAEELGNVDNTIEILESLVAKFKTDDIESADLSADVPEAIFNLGRLYESKGDITKATEYYEILVAEYKSYNLTNLAKDRLLTIK